MKVRATEKCYVDNSIRQADEVFNYDGPPASILIPIDDEQSDAAPIAEPAKRGRRTTRAQISETPTEV